MRRVTAARNARPCSVRPCRRHRWRRAGTRRLCGADASRCEERVLGGAPTLPLQARTRAHARTHACTHARTGRQTHTGNVHADAHSCAHGHACTCHTHAHAYAPSHSVKHATGARTHTLARTHRRWRVQVMATISPKDSGLQRAVPELMGRCEEDARAHLHTCSRPHARSLSRMRPHARTHARMPARTRPRADARTRARAHTHACPQVREGALDARR